MTNERVVLVHAGVADSRMWERQAALLRDQGYEVVAPDLPGFGNEPMPTAPFSYVEPIARLLPAVLVGNSFGGVVALETALAHPSQVPKLVLVAPNVRDHDFSQQIQRATSRTSRDGSPTSCRTRGSRSSQARSTSRASRRRMHLTGCCWSS